MFPWFAICVFDNALMIADDFFRHPFLNPKPHSKSCEYYCCRWKNRNTLSVVIYILYNVQSIVHAALQCPVHHACSITMSSPSYMQHYNVQSIMHAVLQCLVHHTCSITMSGPSCMQHYNVQSIMHAALQCPVHHTCGITMSSPSYMQYRKVCTRVNCDMCHMQNMTILGYFHCDSDYFLPSQHVTAGL